MRKREPAIDETDCRCPVGALRGSTLTASYPITCVIPDSSDQDQRIEIIGGVGWRRRIDDAIRDIETRAVDYWTYAAGTRARVIVAQRPNGRKYLKTTADDAEPDNLLGLPECP
jgi:hypothetical protein